MNDIKTVAIGPKFLGRWIELYRIPSPFEKATAYNVEAGYSGQGKDLLVENHATGRRGSPTVAKGFGSYIAPGQYFVRFDDFPDTLKLARANFLVLEWEDEWAIVGNSTRSLLWLLGRRLPRDYVERSKLFERLMARARASGYEQSDLDRVIASPRLET